MTDKQIQTIVEAIKGIHLQQIVSSPSFDLNQVWYALIGGFASGFIAVGIFWFIDYVRNNRKEQRYYENLLIYILSELRYNFDMITNPLCITSSPKLPLILKFTNWDENKSQVAHYLSQELTAELEYNFYMIKLMHNRVFNQINITNIEKYLLLTKKNVHFLISLIKCKTEYLARLQNDIEGFDIRDFIVKLSKV